MALLVAAGLLAAGAAGPSRKQRLAALPEEDRVWLTEFVAPIILPEEEKLFLELTEEYQREQFKRSFWERRERDGLPFPLGPGYRGRYEELRRMADEVYDGWRQDAGKMVLRRGEPASIQKLDACNSETGSNTFRDLEIWTYNSPSGGGRGKIRHMFYRPRPSWPRKLWRIGVPDSEVLSPGSCRKTLEELSSDCPPYKLRDPCAGANCQEACEVYRVYSEIRSRQGSRAGGEMEYGELSRSFQVSTEGLELLKNKWATTSDPNAKTLHVAGPSGLSTPQPTPTPEPRHRLSAEEMRERLLHLEPRYRQWLELAGPLMTYDDLSTFLQLTLKEKDRFIRNFFKRQS